MRTLGRRAAVHDPRMAALHDVADLAALAPPPEQALNWIADIPTGGVPMLGNAKHGCCVWATFFHFLQLAASYTQTPLPQEPTEDECLAEYATTGFRKDDPSTDLGTVVMGPGGAIEHWIRNGIVCGGQRNFLTSAVTVTVRDLDRLDVALALGPVFLGADLTEANVESDFMFDADSGPVIGGHEMVIGNRERLASGKRWYDIVTWDGLWRCSEDWLSQRAQEGVVPLNRAFFDRYGRNPANVDFAAVEAAMARIRA